MSKAIESLYRNYLEHWMTMIHLSNQMYCISRGGSYERMGNYEEVR